MSLSKLWEIVKDREVWSAEVHGVTEYRHDLGTEQQQQRGQGFLRALVEQRLEQAKESLRYQNCPPEGVH